MINTETILHEIFTTAEFMVGERSHNTHCIGVHTLASDEYVVYPLGGGPIIVDTDTFHKALLNRYVPNRASLLQHLVREIELGKLTSGVVNIVVPNSHGLVLERLADLEGLTGEPSVGFYIVSPDTAKLNQEVING